MQRFNKTGHVESLERILNSIDIIPLENEDFKKAISFNFTDIEDAYQYAATLKESGMKYIITRNIYDFKKSTIPAISAEDFLQKHS